MKSNKIIRFFQTLQGVEEGREGKCISNECETLDRRKGSACCRLEYVCPFLKREDLKCRMYGARPSNCRIFPRTKKDLKLVKNCGYSWDKNEND